MPTGNNFQSGSFPNPQNPQPPESFGQPRELQPKPNMGPGLDSIQPQQNMGTGQVGSGPQAAPQASQPAVYMAYNAEQEQILKGNQVQPVSQVPAEPVFQNQANQVDQSQKKWKKPLIVGASVFTGLILLAGLWYGGYFLYVKGSNARILSAAADNIVEAKNMEVTFRTGISGISIEGKLFVDKDQDLKLTLDNDFLPIELLYIKEEDKAYFKKPDYGGYFGSSMKDQEVEKTEYIEYTNVLEAVEKYGLEGAGIETLNPNKNYFTAANLKYFERLEDEKVDGKDLYKYKFTPDEEAAQKSIKAVNEKIKEFEMNDLEVTKFDTTVNFWIGSNDFKLYKVEGETEIGYKTQEVDYSACDSEAEYSYSADCYSNPKYKKEKASSSTYKWELGFNYGYNEDIELPKGAEITESVNLATWKEESGNKAEEVKTKSDGRTIQTALEIYYLDNMKYPNSLDALKSDDYLPGFEGVDFSNFKYKQTGDDYKLTIYHDGKKIEELSTR